MPFGEGEQAQDLFGSRPFAIPLLGIYGKLGDVLPLDGKSKLALDQGLHEQGEEVEGEKGLNAPLVLEEYGCDLVHGLKLLTTFLDHGLAFVRLKHFGR